MNWSIDLRIHESTERNISIIYNNLPVYQTHVRNQYQHLVPGSYSVSFLCASWKLEAREAFIPHVWGPGKCPNHRTQQTQESQATIEREARPTESPIAPMRATEACPALCGIVMPHQCPRIPWALKPLAFNYVSSMKYFLIVAMSITRSP